MLKEYLHFLLYGYRPAKECYTLCQGSGKNTWLLTVKTNGEVTFSRYGTTSIGQVTTDTWLPFNFCFFAGNTEEITE